MITAILRHWILTEASAPRIAAKRESQSVRNSWLVRSPPSMRLSRKNFSSHSFGSPAVRYMDFIMWTAVGCSVTGESPLRCASL